ncbi:MAG: cytidine deaminase [Firmicutes bacterium]|jgi:cytidine deaminase|nr:cytidine deaminase [Bacillota bacterium]
MDNYQELIMQAKLAMEQAYAPYSRFRVGAALLGASGRIYRGCNIENAAYSPTICAERTAVVKAVSEGERQFKALAVVAETEEVITPCGVCRQVLAEFFDDQVVILLANAGGQVRKTNLSELLPGAFTGDKYGL